MSKIMPVKPKKHRTWGLNTTMKPKDFKNQSLGALHQFEHKQDVKINFSFKTESYS